MVHDEDGTRICRGKDDDVCVKIVAIHSSVNGECSAAARGVVSKIRDVSRAYREKEKHPTKKTPESFFPQEKEQNANFEEVFKGGGVTRENKLYFQSFCLKRQWNWFKFRGEVQLLLTLLSSLRSFLSVLESFGQ